MGSLDRYRTMSTEELAFAYRELGGLVRAAEAQRLQMLAVLDEREAWRADGCLDTAQWVAATDMVPAAAAKAAVATARSLGELPKITAVAEAGGLSMAQLVPLAVVAGPDSDQRWSIEGPGTTPAALAELARQQRRVSREQAERQHQRRSIRWWKDRHGLGTRLAGLLPDDAAAIVTAELSRIAEAASKNDNDTWDPFESRCADALVEVCSASAGADGRAEVVVTVPVGSEQLAPALPDGTPIAMDVLRRLACDSTARLLVTNPDGSVAGYGRRRRIVPDKLCQRLHQRERGRCAWQGCNRTRGLRAHHLTPWIDGGPTDEDNCLLLCHEHHHLVHEGGWQIIGNPNHRVEFRRPTGGTVPTATTPADPQLLHRYGLDAA